MAPLALECTDSETASYVQQVKADLSADALRVMVISKFLVTPVLCPALSWLTCLMSI